MGYRSEIFIIIKNELEEEFEKLLQKHELSHYIKEAEPCEQTLDTYTKYYGSWLKWYNGYKDVDAINKFITEHSEEAALIGIGEDGAESANVGNPDNFDMYVVSTIKW